MRLALMVFALNGRATKQALGVTILYNARPLVAAGHCPLACLAAGLPS